MLGPLSHLRQFAVQALTFAVAIGIVTPAPGLCASCTLASSSLAHRHSDQKPEPADKACCTQAASNRAVATPHAPVQCKSIDSQSCKCNLHQADPATTASEPVASTVNLFAALSPTHSAAILPPSLAPPAIATPGNPPPPIPHRILHCSWII
jgi:hypothetical protein